MKKFFSYKTHFILLVILASAVSSTAILVKSSIGAEQSRQAMNRSETVQKMNPFKRIVSFKVDEMKAELLSFALSRKTQKNFANFNSIALVQENGENYTPKWIDSDLKEANWASEYQAAALKSLAFQKIESSGFAWFKYQEGSAKPIFFTVFEIEAHHKDLNKKAYLVGMSVKNPLGSLADDYRGTTGKVYLLNDKAFVAAHTNKTYDGASFSADPIFKDMKSSKRAMSSGSFVDLNGDSVFAYYEKIEHSNLYAVVSSPRANLKLMNGTQWQAGVPFALGFLGFFAFVAFFFAQKLPGIVPAAVLLQSKKEEAQELSIFTPLENSAESEFESLERKKLEAKNLRNELMKKGLASINPFGSSFIQAPPMSLVSAPTTKIENNEKSLELLKMMSKGLSKIFSERISGMIAESSLILAKATDAEIISHAKLIQIESRKSRDLLRELEQYNPDRPLELSWTDLSEVCEHALSRFQNEIELEGIEVITHLTPGLKVRASIEKLQQSTEKVIMNSIEALKGREKKTLNIRVARVGNQIELTIADTGIGMAKDIQDKIFLPFYRAFSNVDGNGLGLSFVQGVVEAMKGEIKVQSTPGAGTEMKFLFGAESLAPALLVPKVEAYEVLKNPKLALDFIDDPPVASTNEMNYFELEESDLDREFDDHLKRLSEKIIQKKSIIEETPAEFNVLKDFEDEDDDIDNFKVVIREPRSKPLV